MVQKHPQDFDALQEKILQEVPAALDLWNRTEPRRKIAMNAGSSPIRQGLSQKDVAERAGWDKAFVSRLEGASGGMPDTETIARYAEACGATAGIVIATLADSSHIHVVDAVTLPTQTPDGEIDFTRLREQMIALTDAA